MKWNHTALIKKNAFQFYARRNCWYSSHVSQTPHYALHSLLSLWIPIFHNETISSNRFNSSFRLVKVFQFIGKCARFFFSFLFVREIVEENPLNGSVVLSRTNFTWCEIHFIQKLWRLCNRMWCRSERKVAKFLLYSIFFLLVLFIEKWFKSSRWK